MERDINATGGNFSCGYEVESGDGRKAFLKALDYSSAMRSSDPAQALNIMTSAYIFERDLLKRCQDRGLTRIVTAITSGKVFIDTTPMGGLVEYLIFERADGDVRKQMESTGALDISWRFACLHHVATGLKQLHADLIAHQDLKPSNVLMFRTSSKLADLGRASCKGENPPHEPYHIAGDPAYAPPELLYGFVSPEWSVRRLGCDVYLLGSMIVWFFTGLSTTALLMNNVAPQHQPNYWRGTYEDVLPYIHEAYYQVLAVVHEHVPEAFREELTHIVENLCQPDPRFPGHPKDRIRSETQYSLERYISRFDFLAKKAAYSLLY